MDYLADLPIPSGLAAGTYSGTLTLRICKDLACARPYVLSRSTIAYAVAVAHRGAPVITYVYPDVFESEWDDVTGRTGTLVFQLSPPPATQPFVRVLDGGGLFEVGPGSITPQPSGAYAAFLPYPDALPAGDYTGSVTVEICKDLACTQPYATSQPTLPYHVTIHHVVPGLAPLTATFSRDGVAVADAVAGVDPDGARTYAVAAHVGQVIEVALSEPPLTIRRPITGATATLDPVSATYPLVRYQVTSIGAGLTSGVALLNFRVADGRWMRLTVNATP